MFRLLILSFGFLVLSSPAAYAAPATHGWQIGIAAPLATPLPAASLNGFIGHMDKSARSFWARRFGWRMNFAVPYTASANAHINGDDLHLSWSVMGFGQRETIDATFNWTVNDDIGAVALSLDGASGRFTMRNRYLGGLIDFYPFGNTWFLGGLRMSAGYYMGRADIAMRTTMAQDITGGTGLAVHINNVAGRDIYANTRLADGTTIGGRLSWRFRGPYVGTGFDIGMFRGWKLFTDFGVVFANAPHMRDRDIIIPDDNFQICISADGRCGPGGIWVNVNMRDLDASLNQIRDQLPADLVGVLDGISLANVSAEYENFRDTIRRNANDGLSDLRVVPMVRLGIMYRF